MSDTEYGQLSKMAAQGDLNPIQRTRYEELKAQGGPLTTDMSSPGDYANIAAQQMKLMQQANQPVIQSLQASIPETQQKYAAESGRLQAQQAPLEQRYQSLLADVTRQGEANIRDVQTSTSREFGRRGISLQSGIFDQALNQAVTPQREWMGQQTKEIGLSREDALRQLQDLISKTGESGVGAVREIQNAIANLQAGGAQSGITNAMQMYQMQQQQAQAQAERALQEKIANMQYSAAPETSNPYITLNEGQTLFDPVTLKQIFSVPKTYAPKGSGGDDGW